MRVLKQPETAWSWRFTCPTCRTEAEAEAADVEKDEFKTSGFFFDGSATIELCYYVYCPSCGSIIMIPPSNLTWHVKNAARSCGTADPGTEEKSVCG